MLGVRKSGGEVFDGVLGSLTALREKFLEPFDRIGADALRDVAEVSKGVDLKSLAGTDQAGQDDGGLPAVTAPEEKPFLPSDRDSPQGLHGTVVISLHVTSLARNQGLNGNGLGV
jgi:hypothetical protein